MTCKKAPIVITGRIPFFAINSDATREEKNATNLPRKAYKKT